MVNPFLKIKSKKKSYFSKIKIATAINKAKIRYSLLKNARLGAKIRKIINLACSLLPLKKERKVNSSITGAKMSISIKIHGRKSLKDSVFSIPTNPINNSPIKYSYNRINTIG
jgi:hypothetical protein